MVKQGHDTTKPVRPTRVIESFSLPRATPCGGAALLVDFLHRLDLEGELRRQLPLTKHPSATYPLERVGWLLVLGRLIGKARLFHFEDLEDDPLVTTLVGVNKLPDFTLLYKDLDRFQDEAAIEGLKRVNTRLVGRWVGQEMVLDLDSTVQPLFGQQEGAEVGYNPHYRGRPSYHPLLAFDGVSGACLNAQLREGDAAAGEGAVAFLQATEALLPPGRRVRYVRMDKGFGGEALYAYLERRGIGYVGKLRWTARMQRALVAEPRRWQRLQADDLEVVEATAFGYQATDWAQPRRVVVIRRREAEPPAQGVLFEEALWSYEAMVTNLDWAPEDLWAFYNQRGGSENFIKEAKEAFGLAQVSTDGFYPNYADLLFKVLAYNVARAFRQLLLPPRYRAMGFRRLRRYLIEVPGRLVRHARQYFLRLPTTWRYRELWQAVRRRLELVPAPT